MDVFTNSPTVLVADANYPATATDRFIVYTSISASRTVTLPLANAVPANTAIVVSDDSSSVSAAINIIVTRSGSDTMVWGFANSAFLSVPRGKLTFTSDGISSWRWHASSWTIDPATTLSAVDYSVPTSAAAKTYVDTPKVSGITSSATWSPVGTNDMFTVSAQAAAATTINNPSGTALNGKRLIMRFKDNGTARALTWSGSKWRASNALAFPTTTVISKTHYVEVIYHSTDDKWDLARVDYVT